MHRPGHIDDTGSGTNSMDRRKYLKALALGTVAGGMLLESCGKKNPIISWGYLSLYPAKITTIQMAKELGRPNDEEPRLRIPFFNSNEIDLNKDQVVGFHLIKIGCPSMFAIAVNLVAEDHEPDKDAEIRNDAMDTFLMRELKYEKIPLPKPC